MKAYHEKTPGNMCTCVTCGSLVVHLRLWSQSDCMCLSTRPAQLLGCPSVMQLVLMMVRLVAMS